MSFWVFGWFDRFMGGTFGLVKAGVIIPVFFMVISGMLADSNPLITGSMAAPYLGKSSGFLLSFIPDQNLHRHLLPREPALALPDLIIPATKPVRTEPAKKTK